MEKTKVAIYIGRFEPPTNAHAKVFEYCSETYDKTIALVGSVNQRKSIKNPFNYQEIRTWILNLPNIDTDNLIVKPLNDYIYNDQKWIAQVEQLVYTEFQGQNVEFTIVGHCKDESSYYLKIFPNFKVDCIRQLENGLSGTTVREHILTGNTHNIHSMVPNQVFYRIKELENEGYFEDLKEERRFYENEKSWFKDYKFPETLKFNCADAVVVCDGNVLLIKRKFAPGKGCYALPGGFVNREETYQECAIRELIEETNLKVPEKVIKGSIKGSEIFDSPKRNLGIPRISVAYYIEIEPDKPKGFSRLPKISGSDDADSAEWVPLAKVKTLELFDDHKDIIDYFTSSL